MKIDEHGSNFEALRSKRGRPGLYDDPLRCRRQYLHRPRDPTAPGGLEESLRAILGGV